MGIVGWTLLLGDVAHQNSTGIVLLVIGVLLLILGGVFFWLLRKSKSQLLEMSQTETYTASSLKEMADSIAKEIGAGSFTQACEVKGVITCKTPLTSEIQKTPCVYYRTLVTQEYREQYQERDANGNLRIRTRTRTETVSSNTRSVEFFIDDGTGQIAVRPDGAEWDEEKMADNYQPTGMMAGAFGLVGTRYQEWGIPLGRRAYVLGEASDEGGLLHIRKPKSGRLFISLKSEEELTAQAQGSVKLYKVLAPAAAVLGAVLTIVGLVM